MTTAAEFAQQLKDEFGKLISKPMEFRGEITVNLQVQNETWMMQEFVQAKLERIRATRAPPTSAQRTPHFYLRDRQ